LTDELKISAGNTQNLLTALVNRTYVEETEGSSATDQRYRLTRAGRQFALASGAKAISRKAAATKLAEFLQRVDAVNRNVEFINRITHVYVFGSFLSGATELSDIDVAYATERRYFGEQYSQQAEKRRDMASANGRNFGTMMDRIGWPETEILLFLRARSRALSLHHAAELQKLGCPFREVFPKNEMTDDPDLEAAIRAVAKVSQ
jgi:predicted nucleotidyltransferase